MTFASSAEKLLQVFVTSLSYRRQTVSNKFLLVLLNCYQQIGNLGTVESSVCSRLYENKTTQEDERSDLSNRVCAKEVTLLN